MTRPSLFLETTIQIERVFGNRARQAGLQSELANYRLVTSNYVLGEYLRTVVKDVIYLHRLVTSQANVDDVFTAIGQHPNKKEASRMMLILGALVRTGFTLEQTHQSRSDLIDRLGRLIRVTLLSRFHTGIDQFIDTVECGLAQERPKVWHGSVEPSYKLRSQCVRTNRECTLAEQMQQWQPQLEKVSETFCNADDPSLARMGQLAEQILKDPVIARGRNCIWYLGDLVIALELPEDMPLYTTNRRHFEPILDLLGKQIHIPI